MKITVRNYLIGPEEPSQLKETASAYLFLWEGDWPIAELRCFRMISKAAQYQLEECLYF